VQAYRSVYPKVVNFWYKCDRNAKQCVLSGAPIYQKENRIMWFVHRQWLCCKLPSGRVIPYFDPIVKENELTYSTIRSNGSFGRVNTWGGKLVENIVQAVARDILADALLRVDKAGYDTVMHVHDEIVCEVPRENPQESLDNLCKIMCEPVEWGKGIPLNAEGWVGNRYKKG